MIVEGQGELHLNIAKWQLENLEKIPIEFLTPKIPYRETITKASQANYLHKKQSGGSGQFGEVYMVIEPYKEGMPEPSKYKLKQTIKMSSVNPLSIQKGDTEVTVNVRGKDDIDLEWGGKLVYYNCIVGGVIDLRFLPSIRKGILEKMEEGPLTGSYVRDVRVMVYDGKMHPVDSNDISFKIAGMMAFKQAFTKADPQLLEPIYDLEVVVPEELMGEVMTDLQAKFKKAAKEVMELPLRPNDKILLRLYGLYKQATEGNIRGKRPGFSDVKGRAKYDAWSRLRGKSEEWAMQEYIKLVKELQG